MTAAGVLILVSILTPLGLAACLTVPAMRRATEGLVPWLAAVPLAPVLVTGDVDLPALVLGLSFTLDAVSRMFLLSSASIWLICAIHHRRLERRGPGRRSPLFLICFLAMQAGSNGAVVAAEPVTFYVFFTAVTIAAGGMIAAGGGGTARIAARTYLTVALFGEVLALAAFMLAAADAAAGAMLVLLVFGLGHKLGILPLHVALPPAYDSLGPAGGAVFAGPAVNAAVYGLVTFLPLGGPGLAGLTGLLVTMGLAMAVTGGLLALTQGSARALLGYSTVSQMGILLVGLGIAAGSPAGWHGVAPAVILFAVHHAAVKASLLLATGSAYTGMAARIATAVAGASLAGAPLTGGAVAKAWLEEEATQLAAPWNDLLHVGLPLTSALSVLYLLRLLAMFRARRPQDEGAPTFLAMVGVALVMPWAGFALWHPHPLELAFGLPHLWLALWPILLGLGLAGLGAAGARALGVRMPLVPPGDLAVLLARATDRLAERYALAELPALDPRVAGVAARVVGVEGRLRGLAAAGLAFFLLITVLGATMLWSAGSP